MAPNESQLQEYPNHAVKRTQLNDLSINTNKLNVMNICFAMNKIFDEITAECVLLDVGQSPKLVGVHIQKCLKIEHPHRQCCEKTHPRIHLLSQ